MKHREIIPTSFISEDWKEIRLNNSATHSILHDIKVQKQAGGFCYKNNEIFQNRFIYWRSSDDILELSEVSLDIDLRFRNLKIVFENSPVMAVHINETNDKIILLVSTVNNIHRLDIAHPRKMIGVNGEQSENSIFNLVSPESLKDPSTFSTINNVPGQSVPHVASCHYSQNNDFAYFAVGHSNHLVVFQMNSNGETHISEMKNSQMIPRIFSNLTGAIRGRNEVSDGDFASSIVFDTLGHENVLYSLYRDNTLRMWSLKTGQCLCSLNVGKTDQGSELRFHQNFCRFVNDSHYFRSNERTAKINWIVNIVHLFNILEWFWRVSVLQSNMGQHEQNFLDFACNNRDSSDVRFGSLRDE